MGVEHMIPSFAVVGHPNKGKSSIVATLAEDDRIAVSPVPGTTRVARRFGFKVDGEVLYELIDTPGFQRASAVLNWLEGHQSGAHERPQLVARFVQEHADDERFHDECELLRPLIDGAGILYVVDGAKPYGSEYEIEMQVLQWTGRPRMALINLIGAGDYVEEWRQALGQYFSIVRVFDAVHADFDKRLDLLNGFAELADEWKPQLQQAVAVLKQERFNRLRHAAQEIADGFADMLSMKVTRKIGDAEPDDEQRSDLIAQLKSKIETRERVSRERVEAVYRHGRLETTISGAGIIGDELFTEEAWLLFGLSRQQLLVTAAVSGAVAGSGFDLVLGGASLMLGAGVGAALGTLGAWFGAGELAKVEILGQRLGGRVLQAGPVKDPNFPWVLLGRGWLHFQLVSERNHARREALALDVEQESHLVEALPYNLRRDLQKSFAKLVSGDDARSELVEQLVQVLQSRTKAEQTKEAETIEERKDTETKDTTVTEDPQSGAAG